MKILKEAKENLPVAFLTSFVSDGWEKVGILKEEIDAIKKEFKGTKKVEELIQALIDAYLVCIGQMEQHLAAKDYLDIDDKEEVKENLQEDVTINIEKIKIIKPEVKVEHENEVEEPEEIPAIKIPAKDIAVSEPVDNKYAVSDDEMDAFERAVMAAKPLAKSVDLEDDEESAVDKLDNIEEACKKNTINESCGWFCDFDDVDLSQPKLTDADLYPENK